MSDERARTMNTLREIAQAVHAQQYPAAEELLGSIGPEATESIPSNQQLAGVALAHLDAWYARNEFQHGAARVVQSEIPSSAGNLTPTLEALARKGRALRSAESLLRRNPESAVARAGAYMVTATLTALAAHRDESFEIVMDDLLPGKKVNTPVAPAASATPSDAAEEAPEPVVEEAPAEPTFSADESQNDSSARYTAIVETRFMAAVKEFQQWMGQSHPVTGTGAPKRADIKDVAATIGIDAEGVAKKPDPVDPPASDTDLSVPAEPQPTRHVPSAQGIPELMAFLAALQEFEFVEMLSTKVQPGTRALDFGFEDVDQLEAAEELVATYVHQTLTYDADSDAAVRTAQLVLGQASDTDADSVLIPRLRQLETMDLIEINDGTPVIPDLLSDAVRNGLERAAG
ncbi:MAG: hypothetical protein HLX51_09650 [Micrococcaceae bacterium]|nr:hypothetical protein [Micrococcaceae bacterium]